MTCSQDSAAAQGAEYDALVGLLMEAASPEDGEAPGVAAWIARSALMDGHLYKAMGLADRSEVRALMEHHFPAVAAGNDRDMRWKKYLYRRMCGWPGFAG